MAIPLYVEIVKALSDTLSLSDTVSISTVVNISETDTLSLSDSVSIDSILEEGISVSETLNISDSVLTSANYLEEILETDTISLTDSVSIDSTAFYPISQTDTLSITDSVSKRVIATISVTETLSFTDSVSLDAILIEEKTIAETLSITDSVSINAIIGKSITETLTITDTVTTYKPVTYGISESDTINLSDSVGASVPILEDKYITETLTITDTITLAVAEGKGTILKFNPFTGTLQYLKDLTLIDSDVLPILNNVYFLGNKDLRFKGFFSNAQIGDSTNYLDISDTGALTLKGTARIWKEIQFYSTSFAPGQSGATETLLGNYDGWAYSINDEMVASLEIPDDWDSSTDLKVRIYWYIDEAYSANNGEVRWQIEWSATPTDETEAVDAPTHTGTIDFGDVNIPANAKYLTRTSQGTISSASLSEGDLLGLKLKRIALNDGNDPTAEPVVINLEIEFLANKLGEQ